MSAKGAKGAKGTKGAKGAKSAKSAVAAVFAGVTFMLASNAQAANWCKGGIWFDAMLGSYHIHPKKDFEQFNPGLGVECWLGSEWAVTGGGFRNSLRRPSWYGGMVWAPEFAHWGLIRLAAMGGVITGYNYGNWGLGRNHTIGPVLAPLLMVEYKRVGMNIILIPPIPSNDLPFTAGFQVKVKF
ncbi:hypothetical protein [Paraburkholderia hayleyella]|uniref:hypothetical protein n=1 Tax=Paraburkholderia hayleyella TaxID=2152889 RepID=UPI0015808E06|nr:hypothetical protein [Paraburkholderia hayleyella]